MTSKSVTIDQVIAWKPCEGYTRERIEWLFDSRAKLTAHDIAALNIPKEDVIWALLHDEIVTERQMHLLACDFADKVVHLCDDPRSRAAIDAKRRWVDGEIDDDELAAARDAAWAAARDAAWDAARDAALGAARAAAWAAAWAAARDAARAAAWAAAWDAAWGAAWAAARDAARAAAWAAQIKRILEVVE